MTRQYRSRYYFAVVFAIDISETLLFLKIDRRRRPRVLVETSMRCVAPSNNILSNRPAFRVRPPHHAEPEKHAGRLVCRRRHNPLRRAHPRFNESSAPPSAPRIRARLVRFPSPLTACTFVLTSLSARSFAPTKRGASLLGDGLIDNHGRTMHHKSTYC
jgi:hypothetical protein